MYCITIPAKSPRDLGPLAYFVISVFTEVSANTVSPDTTVLGAFDSDSREVLPVPPLVRTLLRPRNFL